MDNMNDKIFDIEKQSFPVVGIASSLENLEAVITLVKNLPLESGMSFLLYVKNQPTSDTELFTIISDNARPAVQRIEPGTYLKPDRLYIMGSDQTVSQSNDALIISGRQAIDSISATDHFFISIALACKEFSRGILLSENKTDGFIGLNYIKEQGGTAFAGICESADQNGNPSNTVVS